MQQGSESINNTGEKQLQKSLHLTLILLLVFAPLSALFYLCHMIFHLPIIFAKISACVLLLTFSAAFFFFTEKVKKDMKRN
jgi:hypothetical protein